MNRKGLRYYKMCYYEIVINKNNKRKVECWGDEETAMKIYEKYRLTNNLILTVFKVAVIDAYLSKIERTIIAKNW